jgi:hypothetical protein
MNLRYVDLESICVYSTCQFVVVNLFEAMVKSSPTPVCKHIQCQGAFATGLGGTLITAIEDAVYCQCAHYEDALAEKHFHVAVLTVVKTVSPKLLFSPLVHGNYG